MGTVIFPCIYILSFLWLTTLSDVPTIQELSAEWNEAVPLRGIATVQNFFGSVGIRGSPYQGTRRSDLISLSPLTFSPFDGNMLNSTMKMSVNNTSIYLTMNETKWSAFDVGRRTSFLNFNNSKLRVVNHVRGGFEKNLVMSKYTIEYKNMSNIDETILLSFAFNLTGPIFQYCGMNATTDTGVSCGWGVTLPINRYKYYWDTINDSNIGVITHKQNTIISFIGIYVYDNSGKHTRIVKLQTGTYSTFIGNINNVNINDEILIVFSFGDNSTNIENINKYSVYDNFVNEWDNSHSLWEKRWQNAFIPNNEHYSGNVPILSINNSDISRMYYFSILTLISLERVNLGLSSRVYVNSEGNPIQLNGNFTLGGAGQFVWDLAFISNILTLLDPESTKDTIRFIISHTNFQNNTQPFIVPDSWDAYSVCNSIGTGPYMFNYFTTFTFISTYIRLTNDTDFLNEMVIGLNNITVKNYLIELATVYKIYQKINGIINGTNGCITNYGGNINEFLEVVSTYIYAVPALNYGNAYMLMSINEMLKMLNDTKYEQNSYRNDAINIISMANNKMYNGDGTFNCLYPNDTIKNVRTIADYVYISQILGLFIPREGGGINNETLNKNIETILKEMNDFAMNELYVNGTNSFRALSLKDSIYSPNNLLLMRVDWGVGGSYPGPSAMIIESLSIGDQNYDRAIKNFEESALVTYSGAMSQGIAVYTPEAWLNGTQSAVYNNYNMYRPAPDPPYQPSWPVYRLDGSWTPEGQRDIANVGAAYAETMIRTLFGFNPTWDVWNNIVNKNDVINAFMNVNRSREWNASIFGLKTPLGFVDVLTDTNGLKVTNITSLT